MIVLEIHRPGTEEVQVFTSDKRLITLGRHSTNDFRLEEEAVSRFHAEVENRGGRYYIRDLDSRNGLYVNQAPVLEHLLADGDEIRIGGTRLVFHPQEVRTPDDSNITEVVCLYPDQDPRGMPSPSSVEGVMDMPLPGRLVGLLTDALEAEKAGLDPTRKSLVEQAVAGLELACLLLKKVDVDVLLQDVLHTLSRRVRFTRGVILVWDEETRNYRPRAIHQDAASDPDHTPIEAVPVSMTIVNQCLEQRQGICCTDAMSDPRFATSDSIFDLRLRSVICVPIRGEDQDLGVIQVDAPNARDGVKESDLPLMMLAANLLAEALQTRLGQEQRQKRERRSDEARVVSAASHCLHSIFLMNEGQVDLLRRAAASGNPDLMASALDQFAEGQRSLAQTIDGLHDYMRGRVQAYERVQVNDILAELLDELAPTIETREIGAELLRDKGLYEGYFDPAALRLLFLNLLINAIEAVEGHDRPMIHVTTEQVGKSKIIVRVQDNGPGMVPELRSRLFTPFFTTKGRSHAGLGLTYARHIVAAHDGRIEWESQERLGTTFTVQFPLRAEPPAVRPSPAEPASFAPWLLES